MKSAPIGMCRVYFDAAGVEQKRVAYDEKFRRPKDWSGTLAVSDRTEEVEAIRWAFKEYADTDLGLYTICKGLDERGIRTRFDIRMPANTLRELLCNPKYVGDLHIGRFRRGKFYTVNGDGEICPVNEVSVVNTSLKRHEPYRIIPDHHEPLIDRETFDRVQRKLSRRSTRGQAQRSNAWLLSGILKCGLCGGNISGGPTSVHRDAYRCHGHVKGTCPGPSLEKNAIEQFIAGKLAELVTGAKAIERLRGFIVEELKGSNSDRQLMTLKTRRTQLKREIDNRQRNVAFLEHADDIRAVNSEQSEARRKLRETETTIKMLADGGLPAADFEHAAMVNVLDLKERFASGDTSRMRAVLRQVFERITLNFQRVGSRHRFTHGEIVFAPF